MANGGGNSVTELSAATGALVKVISGPSYRFAFLNKRLLSAAAVASDGSHVWVTNFAGNAVTELSASTGALVRVISGSGYAFDAPMGIISDGSHVWVANERADSVTELPAS